MQRERRGPLRFWAEKLEGQVGGSGYSLETGGLTAKVDLGFKF